MRKPFKLTGEMLFIALVILIAGLLFIHFNTMDNTNPIAQITIDGKEIAQIDLTNNKDEIIDLSTEYNLGVQLEIKNNSIAFLHSDCPDQICLSYGYINREPQSAVCMPNRVAIVVHSKNSIN